MKALLVIDVQDVYLKRYKDLSFIDSINRKINDAKQNGECIIYIGSDSETLNGVEIELA